MHMARETTFKSLEVLLAFPRFLPYLSLHITIETNVNLWYYFLRSFPMLVTTETTIIRSYYSYRPHTSHHSTLCTLLCILRLVFLTIRAIPLLPSIASFGHCRYWLWVVVRVIPCDSYCFHSHFPPTYFALHNLSVSPSLHSRLFL